VQNSSKNWFSLEITADSFASEAVELALDLLNSVGTETDSLGKDPEDDLLIIGYFEEPQKVALAEAKLKEALQIYDQSYDAIRSIESKQVEKQDWLAEWKKHWKPTEIGTFIIAPSWTEVDEPEKIVIKIEPNMAFGTGTHETTKLCLKAIEENYASGMSFLDVGTGTGILSIAVSKLSGEEPTEIVGCDTDVDSIKIAKENAEYNQAEGIEFYIGSITDETPAFDCVCANVTADIIIPMLPLLVAKSKKILVLSGILVEQEKEVLDELEKLGITETRVEADGEWISVLIPRN